MLAAASDPRLSVPTKSVVDIHLVVIDLPVFEHASTD
jgi:hypothetical protein